MDARLLSSLLIGQPARVDPSMGPWSRERWKDLVAAAAEATHDDVDLLAVERFAERLQLDIGGLRAGDLVRIGALSHVVFGSDGRDYLVRVLDKHRDLLTYLRLGDVPAFNKYRSDADGSCDRVIDAWRDPLTVCFRVERWHADGLQPVGVAVGRFTEAGEGVGVCFDALFVSPRSVEVRDAFVRSIEHMLAPLGIRHIRA
jgi:hypothetical protein